MAGETIPWGQRNWNVEGVCTHKSDIYARWYLFERTSYGQRQANNDGNGSASTKAEPGLCKSWRGLPEKPAIHG